MRMPVAMHLRNASQKGVRLSLSALGQNTASKEQTKTQHHATNQIEAINSSVSDQGTAGVADAAGFRLVKSATRVSHPLGRFFDAACALYSLASGIEPAPVKPAAREHIASSSQTLSPAIRGPSLRASAPENFNFVSSSFCHFTNQGRQRHPIEEWLR